MPIEVIVVDDVKDLKPAIEKWASNIGHKLKAYETALCSHNGRLICLLVYSI